MTFRDLYSLAVSGIDPIVLIMPMPDSESVCFLEAPLCDNGPIGEVTAISDAAITLTLDPRLVAEWCRSQCRRSADWDRCVLKSPSPLTLSHGTANRSGGFEALEPRL